MGKIYKNKQIFLWKREKIDFCLKIYRQKKKRIVLLHYENLRKKEVF